MPPRRPPFSPLPASIVLVAAFCCCELVFSYSSEDPRFEDATVLPVPDVKPPDTNTLDDLKNSDTFPSIDQKLADLVSDGPIVGESVFVDSIVGEAGMVDGGLPPAACDETCKKQTDEACYLFCDFGWVSCSNQSGVFLCFRDGIALPCGPVQGKTEDCSMCWNAAAHCEP